jgi:hypothetical protein
VCGAELHARVHSPLLAAQPLAVEQSRASELGPQAGAAEVIERLLVEALGGLALAHQRAGAGADPHSPVGAGSRRDLRQKLERRGRALGLPASNGRFDQFWACPT